MPFACLEIGDSLYQNGSGELEVQLATDSGLEIIAGEGLALSPVGIQWWEELGRTTLTTTGTTITVSSIPARKYLKVLFVLLPSGALTNSMKFNNDSGANYSYRYSANTGASTTGVSQANAIPSVTSASAFEYIGTIDIVNILAQQKLAIVNGANTSTAGSGTAPNSDYIINKWNNTSAQISRIDITTSANNYAADSEIVVLGHD